MKKIKETLRNEKGFTLIEMLIVILIISVLLILVVSNLGGVSTTINTTKDDGIIQTVDSQMLIYEMDTGKKASVQILYDNKYITLKQKKAYEEAKNRSN